MEVSFTENHKMSLFYGSFKSNKCFANRKYVELRIFSSVYIYCFLSVIRSFRCVSDFLAMNVSSHAFDINVSF